MGSLSQAGRIRSKNYTPVSGGSGTSGGLTTTQVNSLIDAKVDPVVATQATKDDAQDVVIAAKPSVVQVTGLINSAATTISDTAITNHENSANHPSNADINVLIDAKTATFDQLVYGNEFIYSTGTPPEPGVGKWRKLAEIEMAGDYYSASLLFDIFSRNMVLNCIVQFSVSLNNAIGSSSIVKSGVSGGAGSIGLFVDITDPLMKKFSVWVLHQSWDYTNSVVVFKKPRISTGSVRGINALNSLNVEMLNEYILSIDNNDIKSPDDTIANGGLGLTRVRVL